MNSPIEQQAELIRTQIISPADRERAALDVLADSDIRFRSGRMSLKYQEMTEGELSKTAVREAVAQLYHCAASTIRQRDGVCRLVTDGMREVHPLLSYCYWRAICAAQPADEQTKVSAILDYVYQIEEYHAAYGKRPGVALVESWVSGLGGGVLWKERSQSALVLLEKIEHDQQLPPAGRVLFRWVRVIVEQYLTTGVSVLDSKRKEVIPL